MSSDTPDTDRPPPPFQFSLRDLLLLTTAWSVLLGLTMWVGPLGVAAFLLISAVCLIILGSIRWRFRLVILGVLLLWMMWPLVCLSGLISAMTPHRPPPAPVPSSAPLSPGSVK